MLFQESSELFQLEVFSSLVNNSARVKVELDILAKSQLCVYSGHSGVCVYDNAQYKVLEVKCFQRGRYKGQRKAGSKYQQRGRGQQWGVGGRGQRTISYKLECIYIHKQATTTPGFSAVSVRQTRIFQGGRLQAWSVYRVLTESTSQKVCLIYMLYRTRIFIVSRRIRHPLRPS